jgi:hypothetical protein
MYRLNPSDEEIEMLKVDAVLGDLDALREVVKLEIEKRPQPPSSRVYCHSGSRFKNIEYDVTMEIGDADYYLVLSINCEYDVHGADVRPSLYDPGESAEWELCTVLIEDQDQVDEYNMMALREGYDIFPFEAGDDIYPYLSGSQIRNIEDQLEEIDRSPY